MAKEKISFPSFTEIEKHIKKNELLPVYFFAGEDAYQIEQSISRLDEIICASLDASLNRCLFHSKNQPEEILSEIEAFPFLGDKKLVIVKEFEKFKEDVRGLFTRVFENPPETTALLVSYNAQLSSTRPPYIRELVKNGFIFECKPLRANSLEDWVIEYARRKNKGLSADDARLLLTICGDDRSVLAMTVDKLILFLGERTEIKRDDITAQAIKTKQYSIFDIDRAFEAGDKKLCFTVAFSLLNQGQEIIALIGYLNSYFIKLSRISEILERKLSMDEASRALNIPSWLLSKQIAVRKRFPYPLLADVAAALMTADLEVKTSKYDEKTILTKLLTAIWKGN